MRKMIHIDKLPNEVRVALKGRGFIDVDIEAMSPHRVFDEFCTWRLGHGDWGELFRNTLHCCEAAFDTAPRKEKSSWVAQKP